MRPQNAVANCAQASPTVGGGVSIPASILPPLPPLPPVIDPPPPSLLCEDTLPQAANPTLANPPTTTGNHHEAELDRMNISRAVIDTEAVSARKSFPQVRRRPNSTSRAVLRRLAHE
jgi:hypothetical protein